MPSGDPWISGEEFTRKVLTYRWSRALPLPRKSFSAIQFHHEPLWGTFGHPGPWIGTIYLGQKLGRTHPLVGKTSEVCFSRYFDELIKILKKYCLGAEISNWLTLSVHNCSFIGIHRHTSIVAAQLNPHPLTYLSSSFTSGLQMGFPLFPKYHRHNCKSIIMSLRWRRMVDPAPSGEVVT